MKLHRYRDGKRTSNILIRGQFLYRYDLADIFRYFNATYRRRAYTNNCNRLARYLVGRKCSNVSRNTSDFRVHYKTYDKLHVSRMDRTKHLISNISHNGIGRKPDTYIDVAVGTKFSVHRDSFRFVLSSQYSGARPWENGRALKYKRSTRNCRHNCKINNFIPTAVESSFQTDRPAAVTRIFFYRLSRGLCLTAANYRNRQTSDKRFSVGRKNVLITDRSTIIRKRSGP